MQWELIKEWLPVIIAGVGVVGIYYGLKGAVDILKIKVAAHAQALDKIEIGIEKKVDEIKSSLKENTASTEEVKEDVNDIKILMSAIEERLKGVGMKIRGGGERRGD